MPSVKSTPVYVRVARERDNRVIKCRRGLRSVSRFRFGDQARDSQDDEENDYANGKQFSR